MRKTMSSEGFRRGLDSTKTQPLQSPAKTKKASRVIDKSSTTSSLTSVDAPAVVGEAKPKKPPVILYDEPPKVYKVAPEDFKALVQKLTGLPQSDSDNDSDNDSDTTALPSQQHQMGVDGSRSDGANKNMGVSTEKDQNMRGSDHWTTNPLLTPSPAINRSLPTSSTTSLVAPPYVVGANPISHQFDMYNNFPNDYHMPLVPELLHDPLFNPYRGIDNWSSSSSLTSLVPPPFVVGANPISHQFDMYNNFPNDYHMPLVPELLHDPLFHPYRVIENWSSTSSLASLVPPAVTGMSYFNASSASLVASAVTGMTSFNASSTSLVPPAVTGMSSFNASSTSLVAPAVTGMSSFNASSASLVPTAVVVGSKRRSDPVYTYMKSARSNNDYAGAHVDNKSTISELFDGSFPFPSRVNDNKSSSTSSSTSSVASSAVFGANPGVVNDPKQPKEYQDKGFEAWVQELTDLVQPNQGETASPSQQQLAGVEGSIANGANKDMTAVGSTSDRGSSSVLADNKPAGGVPEGNDECANDLFEDIDLYFNSDYNPFL